MKDLISNLISTANDTYNGRFHLQHLTADEQPKGNGCAVGMRGEVNFSSLETISRLQLAQLQQFGS